MNNITVNIVFGISMLLVVAWLVMTMFKNAKERAALNNQEIKKQIEQQANSPANVPADSKNADDSK